MNSNKRRLEIYNKIVEEKRVFVQELAEEFNVSAMTIRRDLSVLEKQRVLTIVYGGAYLNDNNGDDLAFDLSIRKLQEEKLSIAYEASKLINSGDLVYIGIGSTCYGITKFIKNEKTAIATNSIMVVNNLEDKDKIDLLMLPGRLSKSARAFVGIDSVNYVKKFCFDVAFISPKFFDLDKGATVINESEANLYQEIIKTSKKVYLLVDHDKFGNASYFKFADFSDFDAIITDDGVDPTYINKCKEKSINLIKANPIAKKANKYDKE